MKSLKKIPQTFPETFAICILVIYKFPNFKNEKKK